MKIKVTNSYSEMSSVAASKVAKIIEEKPNAVLGLPTGNTPLGMYHELIAMHQKANLSFEKVTTFNLDEYIGLERDHINSYNYFMFHNFFKHIDIDKANINIPNGNTEDPKEECAEYEKKIAKAGGIDLIILGIGVNGHIAFNEPSDHFPASTHIVTLDQSTVQANARFFMSVDEVPRFAITMGIGSIMHCRKIMLLANGEAKAQAVKEALQGPITPALPGSALQLHKDVTVILDTGAASRLTLT